MLNLTPIINGSSILPLGKVNLITGANSLLGNIFDNYDGTAEIWKKRAPRNGKYKMNILYNSFIFSLLFIVLFYLI